jgi:hypothetical protein
MQTHASTASINKPYRITMLRLTAGVEEIERFTPLKTSLLIVVVMNFAKMHSTYSEKITSRLTVLLPRPLSRQNNPMKKLCEMTASPCSPAPTTWVRCAWTYGTPPPCLFPSIHRSCATPSTHPTDRQSHSPIHPRSSSLSQARDCSRYSLVTKLLPCLVVG